MSDSMVQTTKQKIDAVLGIPSGQTIDDFLDNLNVESGTEQLSSAFSALTDATKDAFAAADQKINEIAQSGMGGVTILEMNDLNTSLKQVEDLITMAKMMIKHCYENIVATSLIDSELIGAVGKLIESTHLTIKEFVDLYRSKIDFANKVKMSVLKLEQDKEKMRYKHELDMLKIAATKKEPEAIDAEGGTIPFSTEDLISQLDKRDKEEAMKQAEEDAKVLEEK